MVIAHRIATIIDVDRVLVMSEGRAVEFNHPFKLLTHSDADEFITREGAFSQLVLANGVETAKGMLEIARQKYFSQ